MLKQNVVANRVDKRPKALRLLQSTLFAQKSEHARKCLLAHILYRLRGPEPRTKLQVKQLGKIPDEMLLRAKVSGLKTLDVGFVK